MSAETLSDALNRLWRASDAVFAAARRHVRAAAGRQTTATLHRSAARMDIDTKCPACGHAFRLRLRRRQEEHVR